MTGDLFTALTAQLHQFTTVDDTVRYVGDASLKTTLCDQVAVMLSDRRGRTSIVYSTGPAAQQVAELQLRSAAGPNLAAATDGCTYVIADTKTDKRWPDWGSQATEFAVRSCVAVPMSTRSNNIGSILLVSSQPYRFGTVDAMLANALASHAAAAIECAQRATTLTQAVDSRTRIGQAQGILMARYGISAADAFDMLKRRSQATNTRIRELADHVIYTGELPTDSRRGHRASRMLVDQR